VTSVLESKLGAIADVCMRHGAVRLYAFGSALRDDVRPDESNLDLLVELRPSPSDLARNPSAAGHVELWYP